MFEKKYSTPSNRIYSEAELKKRYPQRFEEMVSNGILTLVTGEVEHFYESDEKSQRRQPLNFKLLKEEKKRKNHLQRGSPSRSGR